MGPKEKQIRELEQEVLGLREEISEIVESMELCRFCRNLDGDCVPGTMTCRPEWRGKDKT